MNLIMNSPGQILSALFAISVTLFCISLKASGINETPESLAGTNEAPQSFAGSERYLQLVDSANILFKEGRLLAAEKVTREALKTEPANPGNLFLFSNLGMILTELGRYDEAVRMLDICVDRGPANLTFRKNRATALLFFGRDSLAIEDIGVLLERDSINEWGLQTRGVLNLKKKRFDRALPDIERLISYYPGNAWGHAGKAQIEASRGEYLKAADLYGEAYSREKQPEFIFNRILMLTEGGKTMEALKEVNEAIKENPEEGKLYLLRGFLNQETYQREAAEADFRTAIGKGADSSLLQLFRGKTPGSK